MGWAARATALGGKNGWCAETTGVAGAEAAVQAAALPGAGNPPWQVLAFAAGSVDTRRDTQGLGRYLVWPLLGGVMSGRTQAGVPEPLWKRETGPLSAATCPLPAVSSTAVHSAGMAQLAGPCGLTVRCWRLSPFS